jgi:uncharacterized membrane protein YgcG
MIDLHLHLDLLLLLQAYKALADLCIRALQQRPSSATQHLVNKSLSRLLLQCNENAGVVELGDRLAAAALQQLQQAGLLQQLPALLTLAAHDLLATAAASAKVPPGSSSSVSGSSGSSSSSIGSSKSGGSSQAGSSSTLGKPPSSASDTKPLSPKTLMYATAVWLNAERVLSMYCSLTNLMTHRAEVADACVACLQPAPAALDLILAALQNFPQAQEQQQQQQQQTRVQLNVHVQLQGNQRHPLLADLHYTITGADPEPAVRTAQGLLMQTAHELFWRIQTAIKAVKLLLVEEGQAAGQGRSAVNSTLEQLLCAPQLYTCLTIMTGAAAMFVASDVGSSSSNSSSSGGSGSSMAASSRSGCSTVGGSCSSNDGSGRSARGSSQRAAASGRGPAIARSTSANGPAEPLSGPAAAAEGCNLPVSPMTSRLFELLGVDPAALQFAASDDEQMGRVVVMPYVPDIVDLFNVLLHPGVSSMKAFCCYTM